MPGAARCVGLDPGGVEAAAGHPVGGRGDADADDDRVAFEPGAVGEDELLDPAVAVRGLEHRAGEDADALVAVGADDPAADLRPEDARRAAGRAPRRSSPRAPSARAVAATSWPMKPAPTIDQVGARARARRGAGGRRPSVRSGKAFVVARQHRQRARRGAGRDHQVVVARASCRRRGRGGARRGRGRRARRPSSSSTSLSAYQAASRNRTDSPSAVPAAHVLRERRPVVRRLGLGADDPDRCLVAALAEGLGASLGGEAATDDDDAVLTRPHAARSVSVDAAGIWARACARASVGDVNGRWARPGRTWSEPGAAAGRRRGACGATTRVIRTTSRPTIDRRGHEQPAAQPRRSRRRCRRRGCGRRPST